jgi:hypothetical protein
MQREARSKLRGTKAGSVRDHADERQRHGSDNRRDEVLEDRIKQAHRHWECAELQWKAKYRLRRLINVNGLVDFGRQAAASAWEWLGTHLLALAQARL